MRLFARLITNVEIYENMSRQQLESQFITLSLSTSTSKLKKKSTSKR